MSNLNYSDKASYSFSQLNKPDNNDSNNRISQPFEFNTNNTTNTNSNNNSYNLFNKNFTTYMKYSDTNNSIDINMALASNSDVNTNSMEIPNILLKNANSHELEQFKAEKLFNNTKESRLNDLLAAASLSIKYKENKSNESNTTSGLFNNNNNNNNMDTTDKLQDVNSCFFLKRQTNGIQSNLFQCSENSINTSTNKINNLSNKKEINTIAIDQVLDKLTNSIKNDKKLASNIRFNNDDINSVPKSSVCSSSSSSSSSTSSCSSSRTESNEKPIGPNLISLNLNRKLNISNHPIINKNSNNDENSISKPFISKSLNNHEFSQQSSSKQTESISNATASISLPLTTKPQFNIENELIKYTKNLKLNSQPYTDFYNLGTHIRNGGFSEIYEGTQTKSNEKVIVKLIPKRKTKNWLMVHNKKYPAEILLHKMSNNISGVVKMLEFFEQENDWIIIMPKLINCMDLFDYLESKQRGRLSEIEACHFFTQLVKINIDLLNQGVVHRDIKSENILVDLDTMKLILIDFGASAICRSTNKLLNNGTQHFYTDFHGTRQYKPPEYITNKKYTALASTIWTLGILLYDMCNGQLPFETEQEILDYNLQIKANVSEEYKQLLYDCLKLDPTLRPNLEQVLEYSWCINNKEFNSSSLDNNSNIPSSNNLEVIDPQVVTTSTSTN